MLTIVKKNDSYDAITYQLENEDNSTVDLTGASVNFVMGKKNKLITNTKATVTSATSGIVSYQLTQLDTLVSGTFLAEFVVTFANGTTKTYPSNGYITVDVEQNLDTSQANVVVDMIAEKQGDFTSKLNSILQQAGNINMSAMDEYSWTATEGQLIFIFPSSVNYTPSTKWFQVSVGNVPVDNTLVNRSYDNQFALNIDSSNIKAGMTVRAMWVEPITPVVPTSYKIIPQQDLPPVDAGEGDLWFDTSDNTYQGTIFDALNTQLADITTKYIYVESERKKNPTYTDDDLLSNIFNRSSGVVIFEPNKTYRLTKKITINLSNFSVNGNNAFLDFTGLTDDCAILIQSTNSSRNTANYLSGLVLEGNRTKDGIKVDSVLTGFSQSHTAFRDITVDNFITGVTVARKGFLNSFSHCRISNCDVGFFVNFPEPSSDGGAAITINICVIHDCITAIKMRNYIGSVYMYGGALDYNQNFCDILNGRLYFIGVNLENSYGNTGQYPFKVACQDDATTGQTKDGYLSISNCWVMQTRAGFASEPPITATNLFYVDAGAYLNIDGTYLQQIDCTQDYIVGGTGVLNWGDNYFETNQNKFKLLKSDFNKMANGTMSIANLDLDNYLINWEGYNTTAGTLVNQYEITNIYKLSITNSELLYEKKYAENRPLVILVPKKHKNKTFALKFDYKADVALNGISVAVSHMPKLLSKYVEQGTVKQVMKTLLLPSVYDPSNTATSFNSLNFTTSYQTFKYTFTKPSTSSADYFAVVIFPGSANITNFYFKNIEINEI
jgi:hypothetical protein